MTRRAAAWTLVLLVAAAWPAHAQTPDGLGELTLQELMDLEVVTALRSPTPAGLVPAALHVITSEEIRRSGARTLVDLLRLVPGVHVAQIDANTWAVGIRGFSDRLAKSMLVMIDGRSVYSPLFAGTYWEVQDYLLGDVERIEIIRGPGGTLWGANAVTGIVNIITKDTLSTTGLLARVGGGAEERAFAALRYGGTIGTAGYRVYGKFFDRGPSFHADGADYDDWRMGQGGFRLDWGSGDTQGRLQGDLYGGALGQRTRIASFTPPFSRIVDGDADVSGGSVLARWTLRNRMGGDFDIQTYFDRTRRRDLMLDESRHTFDVDVQHAVRRWPRQTFLWGVGYRVTADETRSDQTVAFDPAARTDLLFSGFVQDDIEILPNTLFASAGVKIEHNDYSGGEFQPSVRLAWRRTPTDTLIGSVTRAVRTPSRAEHDLALTVPIDPPVFVRLLPNEAFEPEELVAFEGGYRRRMGNRLALAASVFLNHHDRLLSTAVEPTFVEGEAPLARVIVPIAFENRLEGRSYGLEATADARIAPRWRWTGGYSYLGFDLHAEAPGADASQEAIWEGSSPRHQLQSRVSVDPLPGFEIDWMFRAVSALPYLEVPRYATSDLRAGWQLSRFVHVALVGRNLHRSRRIEFRPASDGVFLERSVYLMVQVEQ